MSAFRHFVEAQYAADPVGSARFLSDACVLVRVRRRFWRGLRRMSGVKVTDGESEIGQDATTTPSWKLCPDVVRTEFDALHAEADLLIARYALNRERAKTEEEAEEFGSALVGNGTFAVDAGVWPTLREKLYAVQERFSAAADRWCNEDGYARLKEELKTQIGEKDYAKAEGLIPPLSAMRKKFGMDVRLAPVRFVEQTGTDSHLEESRRAEWVDLIDLAVRGPREAAAASWEALAAHLVGPDGTPFTPRGKPDAQGNPTPGVRKINGRQIETAARETTTLSVRGGRYFEPDFRREVDRLIAELPETRAEATAVARKLNAEDDEAVRVGKMLLTASAQARNEPGMCAGFAEARRR